MSASEAVIFMIVGMLFLLSIALFWVWVIGTIAILLTEKKKDKE